MAVNLAELAWRLNSRARATHLPPLILATDHARLADPLAAAARLPRGAAVLLRDYDEPGRAGLARALAELCRANGLALIVALDAGLANAVGAGGLHLPEWALGARATAARSWRRRGGFVTAAAHSPTAIRRAASLADAVLLSPVFPTASHPGRATIGPTRFTAWVRSAPVPVYALGGVDAAAARRLSDSGASGIAAIGGLAPNGG